MTEPQLSGAHAQKTVIPDVFRRSGNTDCIVVSGERDFDAPDEIRFIHNEKPSYMYA
ncbi:hypothetical protein [Arthrobacter sp. MMS18-M83]|uniref:hypothetical protein n=1 Tax=Arthrobacter sp. MMS18-M83 TaxID=2996261 RepID=UPI00227C033A|nr:hypothetical protein [Arthrobacter sp. MMS18-M83]WAH97040.1 hypothetical protein OW521_22235 [Arthrobacter sp. MMS18-M83]